MTAGIGTGSTAAQRLATVAPAALAIALVMGELHDTAAAIVETWYGSSTFGHGFLIVPVCLYLAWRRRGAAVSLDPGPNAWGMAAVAVAALAWLAGRATATVVVEELSLVSIIAGAVLAIYGWPTWRTFAFPLLYLYFAVPVGDILVPPLQSITADFAVGLLRLTGIPVFADGHIIAIPDGSWYVAEACSGVRFLIASLALGTLFAGVTFRTWRRRVAFVGLSVVVPIVANSLRVYAIILIAYFVGNEGAAGVDHVLFGWAFFSMITLILLAIGGAMAERGGVLPAAAPRRPMAGAGSLLASRTLIGIVLTLAPVFVVVAYADRTDRPPLFLPVRLAVPEAGGDWRQAKAARDPLPPAFAGPSAQLDAAYDGEGGKVYLHIGYYLRERRGAQAVGFGHTFIPEGWTASARDQRSATLGDDNISVQVVRAVSGRRARLIWYWYWVDGQFTGNPYVAKLLEAKARLLGGRRAAAIIAAAIDDGESAADAEKSLAAFLSGLRGLGPALDLASAG
jgi:exosortase A